VDNPIIETNENEENSPGDKPKNSVRLLAITVGVVALCTIALAAFIEENRNSYPTFEQALLSISQIAGTLISITSAVLLTIGVARNTERSVLINWLIPLIAGISLMTMSYAGIITLGVIFLGVIIVSLFKK